MGYEVLCRPSTSVGNNLRDRHNSAHHTKAEFSYCFIAVFIRLNAAAFIKFSAFPMRRLFGGGVCFEITFLKSLQQLL